MRISLNGKPTEAEPGMTVLALLKQLDLNPQATVVQRNEDILDRSQFDSVLLSEDDQLELIRFVGGG